MLLENLSNIYHRVYIWLISSISVFNLYVFHFRFHLRTHFAGEWAHTAPCTCSLPQSPPPSHHLMVPLQETKYERNCTRFEHVTFFAIAIKINFYIFSVSFVFLFTPAPSNNFQNVFYEFYAKYQSTVQYFVYI